MTFGLPSLPAHPERKSAKRLYKAFKEGDCRILVVSKVANFAIGPA
jgi:DNA excision repair protein ERCC-3